MPSLTIVHSGEGAAQPAELRTAHGLCTGWLWSSELCSAALHGSAPAARAAGAIIPVGRDGSLLSAVLAHGCASSNTGVHGHTVSEGNRTAAQTENTSLCWSPTSARKLPSCPLQSAESAGAAAAARDSRSRERTAA